MVTNSSLAISTPLAPLMSTVSMREAFSLLTVIFRSEQFHVFDLRVLVYIGYFLSKLGDLYVTRLVTRRDIGGDIGFGPVNDQIITLDFTVLFSQPEGGRLGSELGSEAHYAHLKSLHRGYGGEKYDSNRQHGYSHFPWCSLEEGFLGWLQCRIQLLFKTLQCGRRWPWAGVTLVEQAPSLFFSCRVHHQLEESLLIFLV